MVCGSHFQVSYSESGLMAQLKGIQMSILRFRWFGSQCCVQGLRLKVYYLGQTSDAPVR